MIAQSAILGDLDCIGKIEQNKDSAIDEQHQLKQQPWTVQFSQNSEQVGDRGSQDEKIQTGYAGKSNNHQLIPVGEGCMADTKVTRKAGNRNQILRGRGKEEQNCHRAEHQKKKRSGEKTKISLRREVSKAQCTDCHTAKNEQTDQTVPERNTDGEGACGKQCFQCRTFLSDRRGIGKFVQKYHKYTFLKRGEGKNCLRPDCLVFFIFFACNQIAESKTEDTGAKRSLQTEQ